MIATRGFLTAVECTKSVFGRGSAPDPAARGSSRRSPRSPSRLGRGTPLPILRPLDAFGVSVSSPAVTRPFPKPPPTFFFWIQPCARQFSTGRVSICEGKVSRPALDHLTVYAHFRSVDPQPANVLGGGPDLSNHNMLLVLVRNEFTHAGGRSLTSSGVTERRPDRGAHAVAAAEIRIRDLGDRNSALYHTRPLVSVVSKNNQSGT